MPSRVSGGRGKIRKIELGKVPDYVVRARERETKEQTIEEGNDSVRSTEIRAPSSLLRFGQMYVIARIDAMF